MDLLSSVYVGCTSSGVLALLKQRYPVATLERGSSFIELPQSVEAALPPQEWEALSRRLGVSVHQLFFQAHTERFRYQHFKAGEMLRTLQYGGDCRGKWEIVDGDVERWEAAAFFSRMVQAPEAGGDPRRAAVEAVWRGGQLRAGGYYPVIDACDAAHAAAEYYKFPGWMQIVETKRDDTPAQAAAIVDRLT